MIEVAVKVASHRGFEKIEQRTGNFWRCAFRVAFWNASGLLDGFRHSSLSSVSDLVIRSACYLHLAISSSRPVSRNTPPSIRSILSKYASVLLH